MLRQASVKPNSIPTVEQHMEFTTTVNLQYEYQKCTSTYQQSSTQDTQGLLTGYHQQLPNVGENKPASR
ncbi:unnamed protein product [Schistosoma mattheei]|uniref:Uncharacterized protein n=1 Tax=Schistosoma mattheei TaxID=31246 RepID=A0A183PIB6_9TREM|nr:unnamed protein product [Schistosoma mattheei]